MKPEQEARRLGEQAGPAARDLPQLGCRRSGLRLGEFLPARVPPRCAGQPAICSFPHWPGGRNGDGGADASLAGQPAADGGTDC